MEQDIENEIPVHNLQFSQNSAEVRVKTVRKDEEGYTETKILRLKTIRLKETTFSRPNDRAKHIESIICLSVEDLLQATVSQDCWRAFHGVFFRRALIYGKIVVQNIFPKEKKTCYRMSIDDGSEVIDGIMHVSNEAKVEGENRDTDIFRCRRKYFLMIQIFYLACSFKSRRSFDNGKK